MEKQNQKAPAVPLEQDFIGKMHEMYDQIEVKYRPDVRWWLAEGLNTDETLRKNIQEIHDSGVGAAEFLAMPEPGADSKIYGWGSEEWTSDTRLIIEEATRLGLGFSLTSGTHWASANLPDTYVWKGEPYNPDNKAAAKELDYATVLVKGGEAFCGQLPYPVPIQATEGDMHGSAASFTQYVFQGAVAAKLVQERPGSGQEYGYAQGEGTGKLDMKSLTDLSGRVFQENGVYSLDWTAPDDGTYALFVYWMHGTSQTAVPSVSTNYTINYMDRYGIEALIDYWEEVVLTEDLKEAIRKNGRGEIYMDSLELISYGAGGIFWGYDLKAEFMKRKGYDVTLYLPLITMDKARVSSGRAKKYDYEAADEADRETVRKARTDFYSVISDMYVENVLGPLQKWLHSLNMTLRAEPSYGVNFEISTPAKVVDGIETESFAQTADIDLYRGLLGSANMYGRIFSSETGAVFGHNYYYNMDTWTQLCYLQFAEGVSRTVFHGYSAIEGSESDTYWPGHEGMYAKFSERFNSRQPAFKHYGDWTRMLARNQKMLRQGKPARDIAILRTDYFFVNYGKPKPYSTFETNYMMYDMAYFWKDLSLQKAGYTYDYFSPLLLEDEENVSWTGQFLQPDGPAYQAVIVYQDSMELSSGKKLLEIARDGLPVLFVNHNHETIVHEGPEVRHEKAASVSKSLADSDEELKTVISQIKALPNVLEVDSPAEALPALQSLGVYPRVAYSEPNNKILTVSRRAGDVFYTFVYSYKFKVEQNAAPYSFELQLVGEGVPYRMDDWTGEVSRVGTYEIRNGRTCIPMTLRTGEAALIALNLSEAADTLHAVSTTADQIRIQDGQMYAVAEHSGDYETVFSNGEKKSVHVEVPESISLPRWDIVIEDWNEGEKVVNLEEKFGHVTREVYYTTKKTRLSFKNSELRPWKDLPATQEQLDQLAGETPSMAHVSGLGTYRTVFDIPGQWSDQNGAYLSIASTGGGTAAVWVNGQKAPALNTRTLKVDISGLVRPGKNTIEIEVASTLTNRMLQRGYQDKKSGWTDEFPAVQDYGLMGDVRIVTYTAIPLE